MAKSPRVGEPAPDFELPGTDGPFRLSAHRGERVVLLFYPGDDTPVCTRQFCSYRNESEAFDELDATIVGISAQDLDSHAAFIAKHGLNVPLLADVDKAVAKSFGAFQPVVGTKRAVIIVDEDGVVRFRHDHALGLSYLSTDDIRAALATLPAHV
jgi:thioredoxin-dependent peroxiredoxin